MKKIIINEAETITAENVQQIAERFAIRNLKTVISSGKGLTEKEAEKLREKGKDITKANGFLKMYDLYIGAIKDANKNEEDTTPFTDGMDIIQEASCVLWEYHDKALSDFTEHTNRKGEQLTVKRYTYSVINSYIMGERTRFYKFACVDDYDELGQAIYYKVPDLWDIPTVFDYVKIDGYIKALKLTVTQKKILAYRLRGVALGEDSGNADNKSVHSIAKALNISRQAIYKHMKAIGKKIIELSESKPELKKALIEAKIIVKD